MNIHVTTAVFTLAVLPVLAQASPTQRATTMASRSSLQQAGIGSISGHVRDANNKPLIGVLIVLLPNREMTRTQPNGDYIFVGESTGTYTVEAEIPTCQSLTLTVVVKANVDSAVDFSLKRRALLSNGIRSITSSQPRHGGISSTPQDPFVGGPLISFQGDSAIHSTARSR